MEMELVMDQEQRNQMEEECMQWVDGWKDGITKGQVNEATWQWMSWRVNELDRGQVGGLRRG